MRAAKALAARVAAYILLGWLGEYLHNLVDLPQLTVLSPENSGPALVALALFLAWWRWPSSRWTAGALLVWGGLNLAGGGILTIIPFSFLPFYPAQTPLHYAMHVVYAGAQVPLMRAMWQQLRRSNAG